jgi:hypothetical protein
VISGTEALLVFYGLFWAAALVAVGRYRLFDAHAIFEPLGGYRLLRRAIVGLVVMNFVPLLWFAFVLLPIVQPLSGSSALLCAGVLAISAFGWQRLLHAVVAFRQVRRWLYRDCEWRAVESRLRDSGAPVGRPEGHAAEGLFYLSLPLVISSAWSSTAIGWQQAGWAGVIALVALVGTAAAQQHCH